MKEINIDWMNEVLNEKSERNEFSGDYPRIDWVQNGKSFKKDLKFKLLPANSHENKIFGHLIGMHWLNDIDGSGQNKRFVCPEQSAHLKKLGVKCPVCEAKRKLLKMGFKEEDLSTQGKFGPVPLFDPKITTNVKVVVIDTDLKHDWDKAHISVLQQNGSFLNKWLVEHYVDTETPDLLEWSKSNIIRFSRDSENGRWERSITFATYDPTEEIIERLKEENEALTMYDVWKMPSDQEFLEMTQVMDTVVNNFQKTKEEVAKVTETSINENLSDDIPF